VVELESAFRFLRDHSQTARAAFSQNLLPTQVTKQKPDKALQVYTGALIGLAWVMGALSLLGTIRLFQEGGTALPILGLSLLALPVALILAWQGLGALRGQSRFPLPLVRAATLLAALIIMAARLLAAESAAMAETTSGSIGGITIMLVLLAIGAIFRNPILAGWRERVLGTTPQVPRHLAAVVIAGTVLVALLRV
jgi:hypothetical protein